MAEDFFEAPNMLLSPPETQSTSVVRLPPIDAHTSPSSPIDLRSVEEGIRVRRVRSGVLASCMAQCHGVPCGVRPQAALTAAGAPGNDGLPLSKIQLHGWLKKRKQQTNK